MFATFCKLLSTRLREKVPELSQIALYNGQYLSTEEELPIFPPACLIEFGEIPWRDTGLHSQQAEMEISFHLVMDFMLPTDNYDLDGFNATEFDLQVLGLVQKLHLSLQGWQMKDSEEVIHVSEMVRSRTRPESLGDGLHIWVVSYRLSVVDDSTDRDRDRTPFVIPVVNVRK